MDEIVRQKLFFTMIQTATRTETDPRKLRQIYRQISVKRRIVLNDFPDPESFHNKAKKVTNTAEIAIIFYTDSKKISRILIQF